MAQCGFKEGKSEYEFGIEMFGEGECFENHKAREENPCVEREGFCSGCWVSLGPSREASCGPARHPKRTRMNVKKDSSVHMRCGVDLGPALNQPLDGCE